MTSSITREELDIPENQAAINYLETQKTSPGMTHPDITQRLREIGRELEQGVTYFYGPSTILVAGKIQLIVAIGIGMSYAIKAGEMLEDAQKYGARTETVWSDKTTLDLAEVIAPDWIFGRWHKDESAWIELGNE